MLSGCNFLWHFIIYSFFSNLYYTFLANCTCKHQTIRILSILHIDNIDNIEYFEIENTLSIFSCNMHYFGVHQYFIEPIFNDWGLSISNIVLLFSIQGDIKIYCIVLHSNTNLAKTELLVFFFVGDERRFRLIKGSLCWRANRFNRSSWTCWRKEC